jgi:hypothetical protein
VLAGSLSAPQQVTRSLYDASREREHGQNGMNRDGKDDITLVSNFNSMIKDPNVSIEFLSILEGGLAADVDKVGLRLGVRVRDRLGCAPYSY